VLTDGLGHLHEFVFAEFAVAIFVELGEHFGWVRRLRAASTFGAAGLCATALTGFFSFTSTAHFAHFFACFGAFCIV
jgi:membrane associated rhomboid family serine protease